MSDFKELADRYIAAWNEPDADVRRAAIGGLWADDGTYTDPLASVVGHDAIAAVVAGARERFPGYMFRLLGPVEGHHGIGRFAWELVPGAGGESVVEGSDVAVVGDDGRIKGVYGFLDKVPAA
ncbi:nuclear transport factor 2 family protein [Phytohabitans suffuscus]|uniref:Isomerase n=1 Tax=Phytohabitans suffuscus TaxID=624315 RepID=A0A6F8YMZ5_9ACTN|nr:nuclear transport factor 2 family protein [Phytohabitans suffuscus]BCB87409.1 isomerase [Phytohabitans suffuscus]